MALLEIVQVRQGWAGQELTPPAPSACAPWAQPASMMSSGSVWMGNSQGSSGSFGTKEVTIEDRKSTRLNSSHVAISYAVFCLKKKNYILFPYYRIHAHSY